jgi:uncharacterized protein (TIGR00369 family)
MPDQFTAHTPQDLPDKAIVAGMSGLEFIEAIRDGRLPGAPIAGLLNFRIHRVEMGEVSFRGTPSFSHFNPMGAVHGGWYGTLLDSAMGCAVATTLPKGRWYTTLEYKVNITRALAAGVEVECTARVSHAGRSTGVAEGWVRGVADGKLYATGSTTCIVI